MAKIKYLAYGADVKIEKDTDNNQSTYVSRGKNEREWKKIDKQSLEIQLKILFI